MLEIRTNDPTVSVLFSPPPGGTFEQAQAAWIKTVAEWENDPANKGLYIPMNEQGRRLVAAARVGK